MPDKPKMTRKLYTLSPLTEAQLEQLQIWMTLKKSAIIRKAVDNLFNEVSRENENAAPKA